MLNIREALTELCAVGGPSGFESKAAEAAGRILKPYVDSIRLDRLGNLIGEKSCGKEKAKKVLLAAHLDEIGLIVTGYEDGFLRFRTIGGVDPRMLPNRELTILAKKTMRGVVTCLPPHVLTKEESEKAFAVDKLFIDAGLSEEEARKCIPVGTPVVFSEGIRSFGDNRVFGKAFDDRLCFVALVRAMELLTEREIEVDVAVVGTVQEELGTRGAVTGAFGVAPDYAIAVDVTFATTPDTPKNKAFEMGSGVALGVGPNINRYMQKRLMTLADENGIAYQLEVMSGNTGTDAWPMQISREGVATALLSIPIRYMHSPVETADLGDVESTARLICEFICSAGKGGLSYA